MLFHHSLGDFILTRSRFTDFLVYEIRKDGHVVNLEDYEVREFGSDPTSLACVREISPADFFYKQYPNETKKDQSSTPVLATSLDSKSSPTLAGEQPDSKINDQISDEDRQILEDLVGVEATNQLVDLYQSTFQAKGGAETAKGRRVVFPAGAERQKRTVTHQVRFLSPPLR